METRAISQVEEKGEIKKVEHDIENPPSPPPAPGSAIPVTIPRPEWAGLFVNRTIVEANQHNAAQTALVLAEADQAFEANKSNAENVAKMIFRGGGVAVALLNIFLLAYNKITDTENVTVNESIWAVCTAIPIIMAFTQEAVTQSKNTAKGHQKTIAESQEKLQQQYAVDPSRPTPGLRR